MWNYKLGFVHFEITNCVAQGMKNGLNPYNFQKKFTYPFSIKSNEANDQLFASRQPIKCQGKQQKNNLRFLFLIPHSNTSRFQWDKGTQHTHTGCAGGGGLSYF